MEAKYFATFALIFVVAAVFILATECTPISNDLENQADNQLNQVLVDSLSKSQLTADNLKPSLDKGHRQGRFYGWPGYGYGWPGYGGGFGGSSATAAATATATSMGSGYPFGK